MCYKRSGIYLIFVCFRDLALYYLEIADQDLQKALNLYYQDKLEITNNQNLLNGKYFLVLIYQPVNLQ